MHAFDVKFEDPSQGFFLREIPITRGHEWSSTSGYNGNGASSSLFDPRDASSVFPTTSIVLGSPVSSSFSNLEHRKGHQSHSNREDIKSAKDVLHSAR